MNSRGASVCNIAPRRSEAGFWGASLLGDEGEAERERWGGERGGVGNEAYRSFESSSPFNRSRNERFGVLADDTNLVVVLWCEG